MLTSRGAAEVTAATSRIRKRCALSSSSSEPRGTRRRRLRLRLKRSVQVIGRAGGGVSPCTSSRRRRMSESSWNRRLAGADTRPTSARKLVGALWQLDAGAGACAEEEGEAGWAARRGSDHHRRSASMELSRLSRRKSKVMEGDGERSWLDGHAHGHWFSDVMSTVEAHACPPGLASPCPGDRMAQLQEMYNSMTASKELVRVLANVLAPGALTPTAASLLAALRSELDAARARARRLAREQRCHRGDEEASSAEQFRERLVEEMRAWKSRHREKATAAARVVASELDAERRARQRAERVSKKLGEALAEAEASLREARRELERERKSRERLEKVCDELAAGVGPAADDDDELRREAESAREELEREREMLQVADKLREERVRMKLAEARLQFEEKNAVVDRLRQELEAFLGRDGQESPAQQHRNAADDHRLQQLALASESIFNGIDRVAVHKNGEDDRGGNDGEVGDGSDGSDIELNVDGNSRDYSWSYSTASNKDTTTAKNAASRSSRHGSFSDRGTEDGAAGAFDRRSQGLGEAPEQRWNEGCSDDDDDRASTRDMDEDAERYEAIKNLREQMLAGHGFVFLSQQGGEDADKDHHRHAGYACQVEEGALW